MRDEDVPFVAQVYASTRLEELAVTGWPIDRRMAFLQQQHEAQHRHYRATYSGAQWLIIELADAAVGRLYRVEWPEEIRVIDISLLPEARRGGIGTQIMAAVQAEARRLGKKVSIHVEKNNPAHSLYRRLGFTIVQDKGVYDLLEWSPAGAAA